LLIDHPAGQLGALRRAWDQLWPTLGNYGPIAPSSQLEGWWFPCPMCHWPMRIEQSGAVRRIRCEAHGRDGVVYTTAPQRWKGGRPLLERSGRNAPHVLEQPASRDHLTVSRAVWRYVTLPGVLERELADYAQRCGATVDSADLEARRQGLGLADQADRIAEASGRGWRRPDHRDSR
jgi:hypothetical protein